MRTFKLTLLVIASLFLLNPFQGVLAQSSTEPSVTTPICQRIDELEDSTLVSMDARRTQGVTIQPKDEQVLNDRILKIRSQADSLRTRHFSLLISKLTDPRQRQAVEQYRDSLAIAINARRGAIDGAQNQYRQDLVDLMNKHQDAVVNYEQTMINDVKQSFTTAKEQCRGGNNDQSARTLLANGLKQAKTNFAGKKQSLAQSSLVFSGLTQARDTTIIEANNQFNLSELQARQQLLKDIVLNR